jgi:hypothetical protein
MTVVTLNDPANPRPSRPASVRAVVAVIWLGLAISAGLASVSLARGGFGDAVHRIQRDHPTPSHQQIVLITAVTLGVLWGLGLVDALLPGTCFAGAAGPGWSSSSVTSRGSSPSRGPSPALTARSPHSVCSRF